MGTVVYTISMLTLHIIIAIASLVAASIALVRPSKSLLNANYGLVVATLGSGTVLIAMGYSALHMCIAGFVYTALSIALVVFAKKRQLVAAA